METKICSKCHQEKPITEFALYRNGHQPYCKVCQKIYNDTHYKVLQAQGYFTKRWREYSQRPEVKKRRLERLMRYRKDPKVRIKNLARWYTNHQIRAGKLNREPCALCGIEQGEAHHLDYNEPLLIVWLCSNCHRQIHLKKNWV